MSPLIEAAVFIKSVVVAAAESHQPEAQLPRIIVLLAFGAFALWLTHDLVAHCFTNSFACIQRWLTNRFQGKIPTSRRFAMKSGLRLLVNFRKIFRLSANANFSISMKTSRPAAGAAIEPKRNVRHPHLSAESKRMHSTRLRSATKKAG